MMPTRIKETSRRTQIIGDFINNIVCDVLPIPDFLLSYLLDCEVTPAPSVSRSPSDTPSYPPSVTALWDQVGGSVEGATATDSLGLTITLDEFGEIAVVTGDNIVLIYHLYYNDDRIRNWEVERDLSSFVDGPTITASLSNNGNSLAIGDPNSPSVAAGEVIIFNDDPNGDAGWAEIVRVPGNTANEGFGSHLSISDNGERTAATAPGFYVRIFDLRPNSYWYLEIEGSAAEKTHFAKSVAISGDGSLMAVGEYGNAANSGFVRLYELDTFTVIQSLPGTTNGDTFGYAVTMSNDAELIAVGTEDNDYVKVYKRDGDDFSQIGSDIVDKDQETSIGFGTSLSMSYSGSRLVVGAPLKDFDAVTGNGVTYLYGVGGTVNLIAAFSGDSAGDNTGKAVALSGDGLRLAITSIEVSGGTGGVRMYGKYN